jgi:hypothetical protein
MFFRNCINHIQDYIREIPGSNLGPQADYPDRYFVCVFLKVLIHVVALLFLFAS